MTQSQRAAQRRPFIPSRRALREALRAWRMSREGSVADGREQALLRYVKEHTSAGDSDGIIEAVDRFCCDRCVMMNVGEKKGALLEEAVRRAAPALAVELGTYCGYSALRIARALPPHGRLLTVERDPARAALAAELIKWAGQEAKVQQLVGDLGDGGRTADRLEEEGARRGTVALLFLDHAKARYIPDLELVLARGLLAPRAIVVADNVLVPGVPRYRAFMRKAEGRLFHTRSHRTHLEYQRLIPDLFLESEYLGHSGELSAT